MTVIDESEALHERVRRFARGATGDSFERLALEIARFQARYAPGFRRLIESRRAAMKRLAQVPAVPTDAFRLSRVAVHPAELDKARFVTSGTSGEARGLHAMRTTETYRELSLRFGAAALIGDRAPQRTVVALAPSTSAAPDSSLGFMMAAMIDRFDGRAEQPWLLDASGVDVDGLERAARLASERGESLLVLGTAFALVALIDALGDRRIDAPASTVVMQTGGFKGRSREVAPETLRRNVAHAFGIADARVVGEYGMTELTSQLYEGTLPGGALAGPPGVYLEPPWLRVVPVDPVTLEPVSDGETGIARIVDLGNVDSAVVIVTHDLVRRREGGIELLGRRPGAVPRGCSLAVEALLAGAVS